MTDALAAPLRRLLAADAPAILVKVVDSLGSAPRESGAAMLVSAEHTLGTIGGGRLEWLAIKRARELLSGAPQDDGMTLALGPALGQSCGGRVELTLRRADATVLGELEALEGAARRNRPAVYQFGVGHVGKALLQALAPLPLAITAIDGRAEALCDLPDGVVAIESPDPASEVARAPSGAGFVVMTHSHALDFAITGAALGRRDARYVGLLGSDTKRARFERGFLAKGGDEVALRGLDSPIGGRELKDKRPSVIAALAAAQIATRMLAEAARDGAIAEGTAA